MKTKCAAGNSVAPPCNKGFMLKICTSAVTSLTLGLVLTASENTAIRFVPKHRRALSEPYVLLTSLSDVWYLGRITVRAAPSVGRIEATRGKSPQWQHHVNKRKMWRASLTERSLPDWIIWSISAHFIFSDVLDISFLLILWLLHSISVCFCVLDKR